MGVRIPDSAGLNHSPVKVTFLGTADAFASGGRVQAGCLVGAGGKTFLLDAGPGTLGALKREGISPGALDFVIVSHLHGDHFGGLPFLILEYMYETPRRRPVVIAGPRNLERRTWALMRMMFPRLDCGAVSRKIRFVLLEPGKTARLGPARVSTIRSPHTKPDVSLSLKLALGGGTVVFSGDTGWNEALPGFSEGADLLICECTYYESAGARSHINYPELRQNRGRFKVGRLILTHLGREVLNHAPAIDLEMAFDGMKVEL